VYGQFISNYHMHGMDNELTKLHGMLKTAKAGLKKGTVQNKDKLRRVLGQRRRHANSKEDKAPDLVPSTNYGFFISIRLLLCKEDDHEKRSCTKYLADKAKVEV
jgi:hypothetical protein